MDSPSCGFSPQAPCASLLYTINGIGSYVLPNTSALTIMVGPGHYGAAFCGAYGLRPINITGAGSSTTVVDCGGIRRMLFAFSATIVTGMTITRGFAPVIGAGADGVAVDGGGAIAVLWSAVQTPPGVCVCACVCPCLCPHVFVDIFPCLLSSGRVFRIGCQSTAPSRL
jgi:hypothetical protein